MNFLNSFSENNLFKFFCNSLFNSIPKEFNNVKIDFLNEIDKEFSCSWSSKFWPNNKLVSKNSAPISIKVFLNKISFLEPYISFIIFFSSILTLEKIKPFSKQSLSLK